MARKQKAEIVYKESNTFPYTPKYSYPISVDKRYLSFWGESKSYRKIINYANHFALPNRILIVYLVGNIQIDKVKKYISDMNTNLLIVYAENIECLIDEYNKLVPYEQELKLHKIDEVIDYLAKMENALDEGIIEPDSPLLLDYREMVRVYSRMPILLDEIKSAWNNLHVFGVWEGTIKGCDDEHYNDLMAIAQILYPCGVEAYTNKINAYRATRKTEMSKFALIGNPQFDINPSVWKEVFPSIFMFDGKEYASMGIKRYVSPIQIFDSKEDASDKTGIDTNAIWRSCVGRTDTVKFGETRVSFEERYKREDIPYAFANKARELVHRALLDDGYITVEDLKQELSKPPYGFYESQYYIYMLTVSMLNIVDGRHRAKIGIVPFVLSKDNLPIVVTSEKWRNKFYYTIFRENKVQLATGELIRRLFDVKDKEISLECLVQKIRSKCEQTYKIGIVHMADKTVAEFLNSKDESFFEKYGYEEFEPYLRQNFKEIRGNLRDLDNLCYRRIVEKYGTDTAEKYMEYVEKSYRKTHARSWVWKEDTLWDEVEYVSKLIKCADCGSYIKDAYQTELGKIIRQPDFFAIQKKINGRDINKFYCMDCLTDIWEITSDEILERIERFREDGCTLFQ